MAHILRPDSAQREPCSLRQGVENHENHRLRPLQTQCHDTIKPYIRDEVSNVWRLWKAGIVRENYARADVPGVVIVFECDSDLGFIPVVIADSCGAGHADAARRSLDSLAFTGDTLTTTAARFGELIGRAPRANK
jgi:hypothetical protein